MDQDAVPQRFMNVSYTPGKYCVIIGVLVRRIAHRWQALDTLVTVYTVYHCGSNLIYDLYFCVLFCSGSKVELHCKAARHVNHHLAWEETNAV